MNLCLILFNSASQRALQGNEEGSQSAEVKMANAATTASRNSTKRISQGHRSLEMQLKDPVTSTTCSTAYNRERKSLSCFT